jgi:hypothetical protein
VFKRSVVNTAPLIFQKSIYEKKHNFFSVLPPPLYLNIDKINLRIHLDFEASVTNEFKVIVTILQDNVAEVPYLAYISDEHIPQVSDRSSISDPIAVHVRHQSQVLQSSGNILSSIRSYHVTVQQYHVLDPKTEWKPPLTPSSPMGSKIRQDTASFIMIDGDPVY